MKKFLFQGDSITDAGRSFDYDDGRGSYGYPTFVAGKLGVKYPGQIEFINRGISGNRVVDLYARIKRDSEALTSVDDSLVSVFLK